MNGVIRMAKHLLSRCDGKQQLSEIGKGCWMMTGNGINEGDKEKPNKKK